LFLLQCKDDLKSDEEIFAEKAKEMNHLQEEIHKLVCIILNVCKEKSCKLCFSQRMDNEEILTKYEQSQETVKAQGEQLVEKEMLVQELMAKIKARPPWIL
jgi:hypothetical protein